MSTLPVIVARKTAVASRSVLFDLRSVDGAPLPPWEPGSHIDVHVAEGIVRQYSLVSAPGPEHRYLVCVQLEHTGRGGSASMHELAEKHELTVSVPRNTFPLDPSAPRSVLIGGGVGVTPLVSMAERLAELDPAVRDAPVCTNGRGSAASRTHRGATLRRSCDLPFQRGWAFAP